LLTPVDPNRKKVTGKGFSPCNLSLKKGMLEGAFGNPLFSYHEYAGLLLDAGCIIAPRGTFEEPLPCNDFPMLRAEIV